jgi:hypothetical protein
LFGQAFLLKERLNFEYLHFNFAASGRGRRPGTISAGHIFYSSNWSIRMFSLKLADPAPLAN